MSLRITHVSLRYPPASGGVEEYVRNLVERLRAAGDEVMVETTNLRTHHPATVLEDPPNDPPYVHRHPVRTLGPLAYPIPRGLYSSLISHPSSLIHAHGFWYAPADIAARACRPKPWRRLVARRRRIPFVLNPYYSRRPKLLWQTYRALIGNRTMQRADAVVVISPQEEQLLRADGFRLPRVVLVPPGIDSAEFARRREDPFPARGLAGKQILLFAGRIARAKGIDLLLAALPKILRSAQDDIHVAIAGEDFGDRGEFEALAVRLGIERRVTWLGKLSRAELLAAYQHAAVFVFPSRYEAFGIAPLEALAAGCPVVTTNTAALPFVVQHEQTGLLFRPEDPDDLAAKTIQLLQDPALARRLAAAGRERAHREFTWDQSVTKLRALYADLLKPTSQRDDSC